MTQQACVDVINLERIVKEIKSKVKFPKNTTCMYYPQEKELVFNLPKGYFVSVIPPGIDHWFYFGDGKLHFDLESDKVTIVKREDFGDKLLEIFDV